MLENCDSIYQEYFALSLKNTTQNHKFGMELFTYHIDLNLQ